MERGGRGDVGMFVSDEVDFIVVWSKCVQQDVQQAGLIFAEFCTSSEYGTPLSPKYARALCAAACVARILEVPSPLLTVSPRTTNEAEPTDPQMPPS